MLLRITVSALAVATIVGCSSATEEPSPSSPPSTFTLRGSLTLDGPLTVAQLGTETFDPAARVPAGTGCLGGGGYDDIAAGAAVTVFDGTEVIGVGHLADGAVVRAIPRARTRATGTCRFPFAVDDVPAGRSFYSVEVSHRGKVSFPAERVQGGEVELTIG